MCLLHTDVGVNEASLLTEAVTLCSKAMISGGPGAGCAYWFAEQHQQELQLVWMLVPMWKCMSNPLRVKEGYEFIYTRYSCCLHTGTEIIINPTIKW